MLLETDTSHLSAASINGGISHLDFHRALDLKECLNRTFADKEKF